MWTLPGATVVSGVRDYRGTVLNPQFGSRGRPERPEIDGANEHPCRAPVSQSHVSEGTWRYGVRGPGRKESLPEKRKGRESN